MRLALSLSHSMAGASERHSPLSACARRASARSRRISRREKYSRARESTRKPMAKARIRFSATGSPPAAGRFHSRYLRETMFINRLPPK